ncbi:MAG: hypothetical protein U0836_09075 [Pirellulales bacterium]
MPGLYDKIGLQFQYPDNWVIDEGESQETRASVTVYSPEGGFWSVTVHPHDEEPANLAAAAVTAMREVYEQLDAEPEFSVIAGHEAEGFEMNFYCLDLTNTAVVQSFRGPHAAYVVFWQAEDREYARIAPVFAAMVQSLRVEG